MLALPMHRPPRGWLLPAVGLIGELVYLAVTVRLPWWRYGNRLWSWSELLGRNWATFAACLGGIALLTAAYVLGWRLVRRAPRRRLVWGFAGLYAATLFGLMPITSDLFTYLSQAHLFTDLGRNPLLVAPFDAGDDPLILAYPAAYDANPSVYGPAWLLLSAPATLGPYDVAGGIFYLKSLDLLAFLGCAWLVERILQRIRPAQAVEGLYLFAWNPLVLLMAVGDGHNDIVMMAVVLLAFWFALGRRWLLAFGLLALSVWVKYTSALLFPLLIVYAWKQTARLVQSQRLDQSPGKQQAVVARGMTVAAAVSAAVFVPFWSPDLIPGLTARLLRPMNWHQATAGLPSSTLSVGLALLVVAYGLLVWRFGRAAGSFQRLANASVTVALLVFVLGAARSQPWHLIWPAALAGVSNRRWVWPVLIGLTTIMLMVQIWVEWGTPGATGATHL